MANKRAKRAYKMAEGGIIPPPPPIPGAGLLKQASGALAGRTANIDKAIDAATNSGVSGASAGPTAPPATPPSSPATTAIIPGLADQMAARQAERMKVEAAEEAARKAEAAKPKGVLGWLTGKADGGRVDKQPLKGLRGYADGGTPNYSASQVAGAGAFGQAASNRMNNLEATLNSATSGAAPTPPPVQQPQAQAQPSVWQQVKSVFGRADGGPVGLRGFAKGGFVPPFNINAASEPWAQDSVGEYENDDWARGGTGSISQRRSNPELLHQLQERRANDQAAQFAHFADGGQLGAASALQGNVPTGLRTSDRWEGGGTTQGGPVPYNYHPMPAAGTPPPDYHNPRSGASTLASGAFGMRNVDGGDAQRNAPPGQYNPRHTQDSGDFGMGRRDASGQQHPQRGPSPAQYGLYADGGRIPEVQVPDYTYDTKLDSFGNQVMKSTSTHVPRGQNEVRGYAEGGPVRSGVEQPGSVSVMNSMGTFSPIVNAGYKPWVPDTPEKMAAYTSAAGANQAAGSTIGGRGIADHVRQENRMGGSTAAWNTQPGATSVSNTQRFSGMSTAGPAPAGPGLPKIGMLDQDRVHIEQDSSSPWDSIYKTPQHMGATHFADGGKIPLYTHGGKITGKGGPTGDEQPILASPGEFVIPADTAKQIGTDKLQALVDATHTPVNKQGLRGLAEGGPTWREWLASKLGGAADKTANVAGKVVDSAEAAAKAAKINWDNVTVGEQAAKAAAVAPDGTTVAGNPNFPGYQYKDVGVRSMAPGTRGTDIGREPGFAARTQVPPERPTAPWNPPGAGPTGRFTPPPAAPSSGVGADFARGSAPPPPEAPGVLSRARASLNTGVGGMGGKPITGVPGAGLVKGGLRLARAAYVPGVLLGSGLDIATTPTADYRERLGMDPEGTPDNTTLGNVAARVFGGASDVANNMTLGLLGKSAYRDIQRHDAERAAQAAGPQQPAGAQQQAVEAAPEAAPVRQAVQEQPEDARYNDIMTQAAAQASTNTAAPPKTIDETNAAARAQMKSMDADNIQKDRLESLRLEQMRGAGELATRKYELDQAAQTARRFPNDPGVQKDLGLKAAMYQDAAQSYRGGLAQQGAAMEAPLQREQQTELANLAAKTHMDQARMGLRGQEYGANLGLAQHLADRRLQLYKMRYDMANLNTGEREKYINEHPSVMDPVMKDGKPTGEYKANPTKVAALRDAIRNTDNTPDILQPTSSWMPVADAGARLAGLNKATGRPLVTAPTKAEYRDMSVKDLGLLTRPDAAQESNVGLGNYVKSKMPKIMVGNTADKVVTLHNEGSKPVVVPADEYEEARDKNALAALIAKYSQKQAADYRRDTGIPK